MTDTRAVAVYRRQYLPPSETFVADHISGLRAWSAHPICDIKHDTPLSLCRPAFRAIPPGPREIWRAAMIDYGFNPFLAHHLRRKGVSLLHAHFLHDAIDLVRLSKRMRLPLVVTAHGYDATEFPEFKSLSPEGRLYNSREDELRHRASAVVCVSDFIRRELEARGYSRDLLRTVRLGVNLDTLSAFDTRGERTGILFVGRMVEKKGAHLLLDAWHHMPEDLKRVQMRFIGDGPLRPGLEDRVRREGINASFSGFASREETLSAIAKSSLLAVPSIRAASGDSEGLPVVVMEAQALGTPVVCFDEGPMPESIIDGRTGFVAATRNARDFAAKMSCILSDAEMSFGMGVNARKLASSRYDLIRNIRELEALYDEVVSGQTGTSPRAE